MIIGEKLLQAINKLPCQRLRPRPGAVVEFAAGGLLGSFLSRNNDLAGHWALGLLYAEAKAPARTIELDLLRGVGHPAGMCAHAVSRRYQQFLQAALTKLGIDWSTVTRATVVLKFNIPPRLPDFHYPCMGDPLEVTVMLAVNQGETVATSALARCQPRRAGIFTRISLAI